MSDGVNKPLVHIEDLWNAMMKFRQAQIKSMEFFRQPSKAAEIMHNGQQEFKWFCEANNLAIDFTER